MSEIVADVILGGRPGPKTSVRPPNPNSGKKKPFFGHGEVRV